LFKWLLQEFFEVFRWREEWNFLDYIDGTLGGKAVVTGIVAALTAIGAAFGRHPMVTASAGGAFGACVVILLWDWIRQRSRPKPPPQMVLPPFKKAFMRFPADSKFGFISARLTDLEHNWEQCERAFDGTLNSWNQLWKDILKTSSRPELSKEERDALITIHRNTNLESMKDATNLFQARLEDLYRVLTAFIGEPE